MKYQLSNYHLSRREIFRSVAVSEYGMRHWAAAKSHPRQKWGHRLIAVLEFCPIIGQLSSFLEYICVKVGSRLQPVKRIAYSTQDGCDGPVVQESAEQIVEYLQKRQERGVQFNQDNLASCLKGGTCSAMAFDFIQQYLRQKKIKQINDQSSLNDLASCVRKVAGRYINGSWRGLRDAQAAMNTIEANPAEVSADFKKSKVQSLANLYNFKVVSTTKSVDALENHAERKIVRLVDKMPSGVYLLRGIKFAQNQRGEKFGHSVVYIKEGGVGFFFDPNYGTYLYPSDQGRRVWRELNDSYKEFGIHDFRFYQLVR